MVKIVVTDDLPAETLAMLQALYSRSAESVTTHLQVVESRGTDKFMQSYYIGYGHDSIGDCGYTTIFIEGVSILACKAIQDNPLYSGQETSTRYIDFSSQPFFCPTPDAEPETQLLLEKYRSIYKYIFNKTFSMLNDSYDCPSGTSDVRWSKALAARAFDVARGFLPAGATTQLAWTTNLRQARAHLRRLSHHPLREVRDIAKKIHSALQEKYPSSFPNLDDDKVSNLERYDIKTNSFWSPSRKLRDFNVTSNFNNIDIDCELSNELSNRDKRSPLPSSLQELGLITFEFLLDYGSFRDLQRHRNGYCRMPLLSMEYGLNPWYRDQLGEQMVKENPLDEICDEVRAHVKKFDVSPTDAQYLMPMGMQVPCQLTYSLPQAVYVAELRSSQTVHPTLREVAQRMGSYLAAEFPFLRLYIDSSPDALSLKRGTQDIIHSGP